MAKLAMWLCLISALIADLPDAYTADDFALIDVAMPSPLMDSSLLLTDVRFPKNYVVYHQGTAEISSSSTLFFGTALWLGKNDMVSMWYSFTTATGNSALRIITQTCYFEAGRAPNVLQQRPVLNECPREDGLGDSDANPHFDLIENITNAQSAAKPSLWIRSFVSVRFFRLYGLFGIYYMAGHVLQGTTTARDNPDYDFLTDAVTRKSVDPRGDYGSMFHSYRERRGGNKLIQMGTIQFEVETRRL